MIEELRRDRCCPIMPIQMPDTCPIGGSSMPVPFMPVNPMYANAYVPYQKDTRLYSETEALMKGTAFVALYEPYAGNVRGGDRLCPLL